MGPEEKRFELDYLRVRFRQAADKASPPILNKAYSGPDHSALERSAPGNAEKANIVRGEAHKEDIVRGEAHKEDLSFQRNCFGEYWNLRLHPQREHLSF